MNFLKSKKKRRIFIWLSVAAFVLCACIIACAVYLGDYYRADAEAVSAYMPEAVSERVLDDGSLVFGEENSSIGFIFYPGGKVEHTAYVPLMREISKDGVCCVLMKMPFNLAVFDVNAADRAREALPRIERWYIGGHSLGGSMAAAYLEAHSDELSGLVLLGSYSTADISNSGLAVLSVYGSEDRVMNREKYAECVGNLPSDMREIVIEGGCHAYFGMYGAQEGDGSPSISAAEQIAITAGEIINMIRTGE